MYFLITHLLQIYTSKFSTVVILYCSLTWLSNKEICLLMLKYITQHFVKFYCWLLLNPAGVCLVDLKPWIWWQSHTHILSSVLGSTEATDAIA